MRTLKRNKQHLWYAVPTGKVPMYAKDEDGNIIYTTDLEGNSIPIETGEFEISYSTPTHFKGYVGSQLEDAITRAWGSDNTNNFAVLVLSKKEKDDDGNFIAFVNGTLIWNAKAPSEKSEENATYVVDGVMDEELNETSYYLRKRK